MGLPPNLSGVMRLTFERFWGAATPSPRFASADLSIASSPGAVVTAPHFATADATAASRPAWLAWPGRIWPAVQSAGSVLLQGMQASRMRQAQRVIAEYRSRLPRSEGSLR